MHHMKRIKLIIGILAVLAVALAIFCVLRSEHALLTHPKGTIARSELNLIKTSYLLMLIVILPTFILLFLTAWKYRAKNDKAKRDLEASNGKLKELILWIIPSIVISVMTVITWRAAHDLDPYRPLASDIKPLKIQVVAMDWKWLFIYPEQGIATLNLLQFPACTPIHFELAADGSPMNSFWIPQLSGQIYSMAGMSTQLHLMADEPGVYTGRAAEINGQGFADMIFVVKSMTSSDFEDWVTSVKQSPLELNGSTYNELVKPSISKPAIYSSVKEDLYNDIIMKYMAHHH